MQKGPLPGGPFCCPFFAPSSRILHIRERNCGKPGRVEKAAPARFLLPLEGKAFDGEAQKNRPRRFPSGTPGAVLRFKEVPPRSSATNQNLPDWQVGALPSGSRSLLPPRREVCDPPLNTSSLNLISRIISSRNKSCRAGVTPSKFLLTECRTGR